MKWEESQKILLTGDFEKGWPSHEEIASSSPERGTQSAQTYGKPIWTGDIEPITLLVNAEFGDGDTIHFWRFIEETKRRVSKVILRCNEDFKTFFSGVEIIGKEESLPAFDKIIHMMALPRALGVKNSELSGEKYLSPNPEHLPQTAIQCLSLLKFHKIGICWAGNPFNSRDIIRSVPIELFEKLKVIEGLKFFTLNKLYEPPADFIDIRPLMRDWNETAHLVQMMDLVITVETSIALLAGAMGKKVWMLVPHIPDWRWGSGDKTVWYDSMKLYRSTGSWEPVLEQISKDLTKHLNEVSVSSGLVCGL